MDTVIVGNTVILHQARPCLSTVPYNYRTPVYRTPVYRTPGSTVYLQSLLASINVVAEQQPLGAGRLAHNVGKAARNLNI